jgi:hypothetical protein
VAAHELTAIDWSRPGFAAIADVGRCVSGADGPGELIVALNRQSEERRITTAGGNRIVFAAPDDAPAGCAYESHIALTGRVPTRSNRHDLFNALIWLVFPRTKARLNALQAAAIERAEVRAVRGPLRDAATVFDENGVVLVTRDERLFGDLRARRWHDAFVARRPEWSDVGLWTFGHALMDKLVAPYKAITAHALAVTLAPTATLEEVDLALAERLDDRLNPADFAPVPLLGIPGWCNANQEASYYDDASVFRPARGLPPITGRV